MTRIRIDKIAPNNQGTIGQINVTIAHGRSSRKSEHRYAEGTIGRDANLRNYVQYLLARYYDFTKAEASFGTDPIKLEARLKSLMPRTNGKIRKEFGAFPNALLVEKAPALIEYLKAHIKRTALGRTRSARGEKIYSSFEEFVQKGLSRNTE